jgi:two-component system phosphate regulon sensor histidine kinase PhoR
MVRDAAPALDPLLVDAALEQLPYGIVIADADGLIVRTNRLVRELLGFDIVGERVPSRAATVVRDMSGRDRLPDSSPLVRALLHEQVTEDELFDVVLADGDRRTVTSSATPVRSPDGELVGAVLIFEDATPRRGRARAEREFVANAAHELRTPLTAIASAVEVLQHGAKELPAERDRFLEHIGHQSERLQRLARSLLLLARADAQGEPPRLEIVPLRPLLTTVVGGLATAASVRVTVRCREDLAVLANRDLLEQALVNVAGNAAHYTSSGTIAISVRAGGSAATISVRDTGRGIPESDVARVFERFYRSGSRDDHGFGLGLPIARHAVEAVGGRIELTSVEGKGTTVTIRVPLARLIES